MSKALFDRANCALPSLSEGKWMQAVVACLMILSQQKSHVKLQLEQLFYLSSSFNPGCPEHAEVVLISRPHYQLGITMEALLTTGHYEVICLCAPKLTQSF